jgi:hypothetical protein
MIPRDTFFFEITLRLYSLQELSYQPEEFLAPELILTQEITKII